MTTSFSYFFHGWKSGSCESEEGAVMGLGGQGEEKLVAALG